MEHAKGWGEHCLSAKPQREALLHCLPFPVCQHDRPEHHAPGIHKVENTQRHRMHLQMSKLQVSRLASAHQVSPGAHVLNQGRTVRVLELASQA